MMRVTVTQGTIDFIHNKVQNGELTFRKACEHLRLNRGTIRKIFREQGLPTQPKLLGSVSTNSSWFFKLTIPQVKSAVERIKDGESYTDVCESLNVEICELRRASKRLGICVDKQRPRNPLKLPKAKTDLAYIAAFVDGEGYIGLPRKSHSSAQIVVYNTYKPVMDWLSSLGGFSYKRKITGLGTKPQYGWHLNQAEDVREFLTAILPYMRVKHEAAKQAIKIAAEIQARKNAK